MQELDFARETLRVVQALLALGLTSQWMYRMMLSRLYYAGHHLGRLLLRQVGLKPDQWRRAVHERVIRALRWHYVHTGIMRQEILDNLAALRRYRVVADCELTVPITDQTMTGATALLAEFLHECELVLGVT